MADAKLSELTSATLPAAGTDLLYLVQGVNSRKITLDNLNASAANVNMKSKVQLGSATSTVSSAGASIPVTATVTFLNSTDGPGRIFIPSGSENQIKVITMTVYGGDYWISSNIANEANILFGNVGDTAIFIYSNNKWNVMGRNLTGVTQYVSLATSNVLTGGAGISIAANGLVTATETYTGTVSNVFGQTTSVSNAHLACAAITSGVLNTSNVVEGANLYFTNTRVVYALTAGSGVNIAANGRITAFGPVTGNVTSVNGLFGEVNLDTGNVFESGNLYFTNARVYSNVIALGYTTNAYVDSSLLAKANVADLTTSNVIEGSNLYFNNTRTVYALTGGSGIIINSNGLITNTVTGGTGFDSSNIIINTSNYKLSSGSGNLWVGQSGVVQATDVSLGIYNSSSSSNNAVFLLGTNGAGTTSLAVEGSLFVGTSKPSNDGGVTSAFPGWLVVQNGAKFGAGTDTLGSMLVGGGVIERYSTINNANNIVDHDCSLGHIFYHNTPTNNWTANFTINSLTGGYASNYTLVVNQGGTGYYANAVQMGGTPVTINWLGNTLPVPSINRVDIINFSILQSPGGSFTVLGQLTGF